MDLLAHLVGLSVLAAVLTAVGVGLALLHARAVRRPLGRAFLPVSLPAALWAGASAYLLAQLAADPTAANLWPLTVALMASLWLGWIAVTWLAAVILGAVRGR